MDKFLDERIKAAIKEVSREREIPEKDIRACMENVIQIAQSSSDVRSREVYSRLFGECTPTVEEFLIVCAALINQSYDTD